MCRSCIILVDKTKNINTNTCKNKGCNIKHNIIYISCFLFINPMNMIND